MALKSKLYIAFIIMILLSVITAVISIRAFRQAKSNVVSSREQVDYVAKDLVPANERWLNISTQIVASGLNYYAYALGFNKRNYDRGYSELAVIDEEFAELDKVLASADADKLLDSRSAIAECRRSAEELKTLGRQAFDTVARIEQLNQSFISIQDEITAIADAEYIKAYDALKDLLDAEPAAPPPAPAAEGDAGEDGDADGEDDGGTALAPAPAQTSARSQQEVDARVDRVEFLSDVFDNVAWSNQAFWRGQSLRGEAAKKYYDESQQHLQNLITRISEYNTPENVPDQQERALFNQIKATADRLIGVSVEIEDGFLAMERLTVRLDKVAGDAAARARIAASATSRQVLDNANLLMDGTVNLERSVATAEWMQFAVLVGTILAGLLLAWSITRGIVNPIDRAIAELNQGMAIISGASEHIASASSVLAEGASEQSSSLEETSSALEQIASMSKMSADNAGRVNQQTQTTVKLIRDGADSMGEMSSAMTEINERSEKVSQIIKTIEDIAFQTNLLALNAAVEAARAGEAGKGFAVVADEVRNLSQRSAAAARDTTALIEGTVESIRNGSQITERLESSYHEIQEGTNGIGDLIQQIAQAADEQAQGVEQVNHAIAQMDKVTGDNAQSSEETAAAARELSGQMGTLRRTISELSSLIHGGKAPDTAAAPRPAPPRPAHSAPRPKITHRPPEPRTAQAPAQPESGQAIMRPDDIIPLEGDFDDF